MAETVLISGASGLVGKAAVKALRAHGYDVLRLVRKPVDLPDEVSWSPGHVDLPADRVIDHVVHLAGEPVFGLWTKEKKKRIFESRVRGTRTITDFCISRPKKPKTLISASAIGIYGNRGDEVLTEASPPGDGFLADVARSWEAAAEPARSLGIRVVHPRIGVVLSKDGGALAAMKLPFQLGLGGRLGNGKQWFSWITLDDLVQIIVTAIEDKQFSGAINCTAPEPVTNRDFVKVLSYVLNRPAIIPVPAFALKLLPGDMANEALLASERVIPQRLLDAGFKFKHPELLQALTSSLQLQL
jgi:hypothetical protein